MLLSRATGAGAIPAVGRDAAALKGVPGGPMQSEQALGRAGDIIEFVRQALADA